MEIELMVSTLTNIAGRLQNLNGLKLIFIEPVRMEDTEWLVVV